LIAAILLCNVIDLGIAIYLVRLVDWKVMIFAVAGLAASVFYVAPPLQVERSAEFGEPAIFLIWGPLMICGSYYVCAGNLPLHIWIASIPYGLGVTAVLMGKHLTRPSRIERRASKLCRWYWATRTRGS